jgi:hypothetical protein
MIKDKGTKIAKGEDLNVTTRWRGGAEVLEFRGLEAIV